MNQKKYSDRPKIFNDLDRLTAILPTPIYWLDLNGTILGANQLVLDAIAAQLPQDYIGKSIYEIYPKEMAEHIKTHNDEVIRTGKILSQEELVTTIDTNEKKYFTAVKAPLYDEHGTIIAIVGTSIDITAKKEAERLQVENLHLENEIQRQSIAEHETYSQLATQVVHDIRSPLAALNTALKSLPQLPEQERIILRNAAQRINDIANNLLHQYKHKDNTTATAERGLQDWLIVPIIEMIVTEKRLLLKGSEIVIDTQINDTAYSAFAKVELTDIKRLLSNVINNAIEAFQSKAGKIIIAVNANPDQIGIDICDTGCGIEPERLAHIFDAKITTKQGGTGIGLSHAKHVIEKMEGKISLRSEIGEGTVLSLQLPVTQAPSWFASEIVIDPASHIIILDDDESIHGAWDSRLQALTIQHPVLHFRKGTELMTWRRTHPDAPIVVLSDYELLGESISGLDILESLQIGNNGVLITSHYEREDIVTRCVKAGIRLLPKNLVAHIPLRINTAAETRQPCDAILLDDDSLVTMMWLYCAEQAGQKIANLPSSQ